MNDMAVFYPQIREVHILAASASGALFAVRGACAIAGMRWQRAALVRYASYTIDTTLLTAALMLVTILHQYPFVQAWLTAKVLLLVVYVALGTLALKRGRTRGVQVACFFAALAVFAMIVGIARAHDPRGWFAPLLS